MDYKNRFIEFMVSAGVLTFGDFTTKSGRKTPYFINTGNYKTGKQISNLGGFYASCIIDNMDRGNIDKDVDSLFGPAYKGIPISVATAIAMAEKHDMDINYCSNRKEVKDHGEGGSLMGYQLKKGDSVLIVEDVITAGTAMRECIPILTNIGVKIEGLIVSVDRMERGTGTKTAIQEMKEDFGINTYPIVTVRDIINHLHGKEIDGKVLIDNETKERMENYLKEYCAE